MTPPAPPPPPPAAGPPAAAGGEEAPTGGKPSGGGQGAAPAESPAEDSVPIIFAHGSPANPKFYWEGKRPSPACQDLKPGAAERRAAGRPDGALAKPRQ